MMRNLPHSEIEAMMREVGREIVMPRYRNLTADQVSEKAADDYVTIADQGLPVTVKRVEDVGRHHIVRAEFQGAPLNAILPEGAPVPADPRAAFAPGKINVYANDWRVAPMGG